MVYEGLYSIRPPLGDSISAIRLASFVTCGFGLDGQEEVFARPNRLVGIILDLFDDKHLLCGFDKLQVGPPALFEAEITGRVGSY